jgi:glutamate dehydrogenase
MPVREFKVATIEQTGATPPGERALAAALFDSALPGEADHIDAAAAARIVSFVETAAVVRMPGCPVIALDNASSGRASPGRRRLALVIINDNMPFLVDSVSNAITAAGLGIDRLLHPIVDVRRDADGRLIKLIGMGAGPIPEGVVRESIIYIELERAGARSRVELIDALGRVLVDVRAAVDDWPAMLATLQETTRALGDNPPPIAPHASAEAMAFLEWLAADRFTLLGTRRYALDENGNEMPGAAGLGLLRDPAFKVWDDDGPAPSASLQRFLISPEPLLITKAGALSTVHRRVNADLIAVKTFDRDGRAVAETRFVGLFTSAALATSPRSVPLLRRKVAGVTDALGFDPKSHTGKALAHVIEGFPREELFETTPARLRTMALGLLSLLDRPRPKLFARADAFGRFVSVLVYVPRDAYTSGVRESVGAMLTRAFDGTLTRYEVELRAEGLARVHYVIAVRHEVGEIDEAALDAKLDALVRGWDEALETALVEAVGPARAARLMLGHGKGFSASYRSQYSAVEAAADLVALSGLDDDRGRAVQLYRRDADLPHQLRLKIYRLGKIIALSDAVPVLENFGLRVIEEFPFDLDGGAAWVHDFLLEAADTATTFDLAALRRRVEPALTAVLLGAQENDGFNALVIAAGLDAEEAGWLRAYFRYLRQTGVSYGLMTVVDALRRYPQVTRDLVALFRARFGGTDVSTDAIDTGLAAVTAIDDDRILRLYRAVIVATLRTNAFVPNGPEALAFKLDSSAVPGLPRPVPYREIWVFSPRVEGIHLRYGPIARGGLRWSDRRDDFRTEVLGLVKAQKVKNTVIVPTGAKGGFYPKLLPAPSNRDAWLAEGTEAYKIFIRALLSLTDNLAVDGSNIPPAYVVCRDTPDPYLVVAADKGTATFSDTANQIALDAGFWLGDAFASGGRVGYDHKAMAITARGAWISVQRHFRELGHDVQTEATSVVGVGDMSGDVFGNGMLLSPAIRLLAAFDHRHIFLDPAPDAAASFAERARLFALPRSSWDDYDKTLLSSGGGVFPRSQKAIPISAAVKAALGIAVDTLSASDLIVAILTAKVDLLWFGGIGTYVKAAAESNNDVGDRANDAHRIDGAMIGAKVVGEGANLGLTQAGRIEFAAKGGRLNTDFIDNSAGVDCSDNEVNIKIALNAEVAAGRLTEPARNDLLASMTDDVATLVLRDNTLQTQALSIAERGGVAALPGHIRLIEMLEDGAAELDRKVEGLASDEVLAQRGRSGQGLERPELAVVMAYAKMAVYDALVGTNVAGHPAGSPLVDDPILIPDLHAAFPRAMQEGFAAAIDGHRLRRELIATKLANAVVNRGGLTLPFELAEEFGVDLAEVAGAFVAARALFAFRDLWAAIDTADIPGPVQLDLHVEAVVALRMQMADLLRAGSCLAPSVLVAKLAPGIARLGDNLDDLLRPEPKAQLDRFAARLAAMGAPADVASRLVRITALDGAVGTGLLAADLGVPEAAIASAYTGLGEATGLDWAKGAAAALTPADPWERLLQAGLVRDFEALRLDLLRRIVPTGGDPVAAVADWELGNAARIVRIAGPIARARSGGPVTTAMLAHLAGQARAALAL